MSYIPPVIGERMRDVVQSMTGTHRARIEAMSDIDMQVIESAAKALAEARDELAARVQRLQDEQESIKRKLLRGLRNAVQRMRAEYEDLLGLVQAKPGLFARPKTRVLHGIRLGWMKQRGRLEIDDPKRCVELIRKLLPEQAAALIRTVEEPNRSALAELPAKDLRRIGVVLTDDTETPFVKATDSAVDKLIAALLKDSEIEELAP